MSWAIGLNTAAWRCKLAEALYGITISIKPAGFTMRVNGEVIIGHANDCPLCPYATEHVCLPISFTRGETVTYFNSRDELLRYFARMYVTAYSGYENDIRAIIADARTHPDIHFDPAIRRAYEAVKARAPILCANSKFTCARDQNIVVLQPRVMPKAQISVDIDATPKILDEVILDIIERRMLYVAALYK